MELMQIAIVVLVLWSFYLCYAEMKARRERDQLKELAREMFEADHAYGCGFYSDDRWQAAYLELQKIAGFDKLTAVYDPDFDSPLKDAKIKDFLGTPLDY